MSKFKAYNKKAKFMDLVYRNKVSNGYLFKKIAGKWIYSFIRAFLLFGLCFLIIQPLLNKISVSFMMEKDLYDVTVIAVPRNFTLANYELGNTLLNYPSSLLKTFLMAFGVAFFQVFSCTLIGYGFARYKFPFKNFWFICVMLIILVPPQTIMSSLYLHFRFFDFLGIVKLVSGSPANLLNSPIPYLVMAATGMGLKSGLYIFMLRQHFRGIPKELEEAAYVDGCGKLRTFFQIMLPDAKAMITSCFLFSFVWQWTDSIYTALFLKNLNLLSSGVRAMREKLTNYLEGIIGPGTIPTMGYREQMVATGMLMFIVPLIILYLFAQKGFVESLSQSGIKM